MLWYNKQNQIQRMKIKKNEFEKETGTAYEHPLYHVMEVIKPFTQQILRNGIEIFVVESTGFR
jgi:hypothetical protein